MVCSSAGQLLFFNYLFFSTALMTSSPVVENCITRFLETSFFESENERARDFEGDINLSKAL